MTPPPKQSDTLEMIAEFERTQEYGLKIMLMQRIRSQATDRLQVAANYPGYPQFFRLWVEQELMERKRLEERQKQARRQHAKAPDVVTDELLPPDEQTSILKARWQFKPREGWETGFVGRKFSYDLKSERIKFNEQGPMIRQLVEQYGAGILDEISGGKPLKAWANFTGLFNRMKAQGNIQQFTIYCNYWYEPTPLGVLPMQLFEWKE